MKIIWKEQVVKSDGVSRKELISWLTPITKMYLYDAITTIGDSLFHHKTINTFTQYRERFGKDLIAYVSESDNGRWKLKLEGKNRQLLCNELSTFEMDEAQSEAEEIIDRYLQDFMIHGNL